ncbi:MAG: HAD hydrolase-like protein, partial [Candidatus Aenigmarchaeota archaeon]|nr:HAD hydrolase-like protein [Candidatus Aenigmarchaeota archaeon]
KLGTTHKETMKLRKEILEGYKPKPGMLDLLKRLQKNYRLIVFSGNIRERVMMVNRKYKVNKFFSEFIFSYIQGYNKNDSRFYKIIQKRIKYPEQTIMIDDKKRVLDQMNKHGFKNTILFKNPTQLKRELKKYNII